MREISSEVEKKPDLFVEWIIYMNSSQRGIWGGGCRFHNKNQSKHFLTIAALLFRKAWISKREYSVYCYFKRHGLYKG